MCRGILTRVIAGNKAGTGTFLSRILARNLKQLFLGGMWKDMIATQAKRFNRLIVAQTLQHNSSKSIFRLVHILLQTFMTGSGQKEGIDRFGAFQQLPQSLSGWFAPTNMPEDAIQRSVGLETANNANITLNLGGVAASAVVIDSETARSMRVRRAQTRALGQGGLQQQTAFSAQLVHEK